ncbi:hypothetical protein DQ04_03101030 [Trypanosoma grayi]|uniref:hypothetical protein n=1 Tax=Trypanosoma grayi TaxID=71804 RepID=UPI0004F47644|nr:hypothetical protein DQ04_03101030 [Trypanosoma grayi]KEG10967.1 hypothetical protein DQ04_03101030 [Trypanosoma grayi]
MQHNEKKADPPLQKFRPRMTPHLSSILKPDVLDDETRQRIVRNVMGTEPHAHDGRNTPASPHQLSGARPGREGNHPASLRDRVSSGNADLLTVMTQRLKMLESQQHAYRMELKEKTELLSRADARYEAEKVKREEVESVVVELYNNVEELEEQVNEMQKFLADYGLQWVGDCKKKKKSGGAQQSQDSSPKAKVALSSCSPPPPPGDTQKPFELYSGDYVDQSPVVSRSPTPSAGRPADVTRHSPRGGLPVQKKDAHPASHVSIEVLKRHAQILSDHVGYKGVVTDGKNGGIKEREVVRIAVYRDGICVNSGPFRPFGWPLCDAVLSDLADGYYPYEFKQRYPDGFPIEIIDQTSVCCMATKNPEQGSNVKGVQHTLQDGGYQPLQREEFLQRLPATRITSNGRIVPVREGIANMIGGRGSSDGPVECDTVRHVTEVERQTKGEVTGSGTQDNNSGAAQQRVKGLVAVLLRFPSGGKVAMYLAPENTIADLRREIKTAMPSFTATYDIRLSFPAVNFTDNAKTLHELGLVKSCTLMIQPRTHVSNT